MYTSSSNRVPAGECRRSTILVLAAAALMLATPLSVFATTYYVSPSGSDSNNGTSTSTPWQTLAKVNGFSFKGGDQIFFIAGGVWNGQLEPSVSGSQGSPIVVNMYNSGARPIINGPGTNGSAAVALNGQSYWEFNNLAVTNQQPSGGTNDLYGFYISGTDTHVYVQNCNISNVQSTPVGTNYDKYTGGVIFNGTFTDIRVSNCTLSNIAVTGIRVLGSADGFVVSDNLIENVYGDGLVLEGAGTSSPTVSKNNTLYNVCESSAANYAGMWSVNTNGGDTIIEQNEIYGLVGGSGDGEPFDSDINTTNTTFEYNYTHDNNHGFMLLMSSAQEVTVRYNISQNDDLDGNHYLFHEQSGGFVSNQVYNNDFYVSNKIPEVFLNATTITFNNNILDFNVAPTQFSNIAFGSSSTFKNNDFFPASIISTNGPGGTVSGNITSDPKFISPGTGYAGMNWNSNGFATAQTGYQLLNGSPTIGAGVVISNNGGFDYWGNSVSSSSVPNIGAYNGSGAGSICSPAITPYIWTSTANGWAEINTVNLVSGATVDLGPQPNSGGSWSWTGPNGFTSTSRQINNISLSVGTNTYVVTYTNSSGCKSTEPFVIVVTSKSCTPSAITPYIWTSSSNSWADESLATVTSGTTVDLGPQPLSGGSWSWTGPNGFNSTSRQINNISLSSGGNTYVATYTNTSGCPSALPFVITE